MPKRDLNLTELSFFETFARGHTGSVAPCLVGFIGTVGALVTSVSPIHTPPTLNTAKLMRGTRRFVYEINKKNTSENQQFALVSAGTVSHLRQFRSSLPSPQSSSKSQTKSTETHFRPFAQRNSEVG